ncbi:PREDICTED: octapeptide-repeat protein T2-like, partial [Vollenhovia emeryi]|uniref:octapeptide-repeat protein T2-like n=1 Tax=Vollenhovia emeryi TaxID=411798 RepID=UPI0005F3F732
MDGREGDWLVKARDRKGGERKRRQDDRRREKVKRAERTKDDKRKEGAKRRRGMDDEIRVIERPTRRKRRWKEKVYRSTEGAGEVTGSTDDRTRESESGRKGRGEDGSRGKREGKVREETIVGREEERKRTRERRERREWRELGEREERRGRSSKEETWAGRRDSRNREVDQEEEKVEGEGVQECRRNRRGDRQYRRQ